MLVMLRKALAREDIKVDTALNAIEALKLARETEYDLALIDIYMKPVGGLELLGQLREINPRVPAIVITGYPSQYTLRRSAELGAVNYLSKPIGINELNNAVHSALND